MKHGIKTIAGAVTAAIFAVFKLYSMPENARMKLQETLIKIVNQGNGGLIAIML